jgi:GH24 family phage-related lysozyme (muramidase)
MKGWFARLRGRNGKPTPKEQIEAAVDAGAAGAEVVPKPRVVFDPPMPPYEYQPDPPLPPITHPVRDISQVGIDLLHKFEGCARFRPDGRYEAYPDPGTGAEPWTIGWGSTRNGLHGFVGRNTVWTKRQCDERFADDLRRVYVPEVLRALDGAPVTQGQFDALVSFHYNTGAIHRATLTRKHKEGDYVGAANEFARWNRAGGQVMRGLTRRRDAEAAIYRSDNR